MQDELQRRWWFRIEGEITLRVVSRLLSLGSACPLIQRVPVIVRIAQRMRQKVGVLERKTIGVTSSLLSWGLYPLHTSLLPEAVGSVLISASASASLDGVFWKRQSDPLVKPFFSTLNFQTWRTQMFQQRTSATYIPLIFLISLVSTTLWRIRWEPAPAPRTAGTALT